MQCSKPSHLLVSQTLGLDLVVSGDCVTFPANWLPSISTVASAKAAAVNNHARPELLRALYVKRRKLSCRTTMVVDGKVELIMAVHVDDTVIAGLDEACRDFHAALNTKFPTNNLGESTWYTGCAFKRNWELGTLEITQKAFVESMMNRFGANSFSDIPATPGVELGPREEGEPKGDWPYRGAVGSLMWLSTMTRPDISNAVRAVARHSHNPIDRHWKAVLKITAYLHGTRGMGLTFVRGSGLDLKAYSAAVYADKSNDRRSVSGTVISLGGAAVS